MKTPLLSLLLLAPLAGAGEFSPGQQAASDIVAAGGQAWLRPHIDVRARYEFANMTNFDASHALTVRARPGLQTAEWGGFSALVEGEFTGALIEDFDAGGGAWPRTPGNTVINDPNSAELNQAYLQYHGFNTRIRAGRQRLIYDNAAFIGNSGWRQNEQTFDAVSLQNNSLEPLTLNLAWIGRVNRILGSTAAGPFRSLRTNILLANAWWTVNPELKVGAYYYRMRFHRKGAIAQSSGLDNDTVGMQTDFTALGLDFHGELAWQEKAGPANNQQGWYTHLNASKKFGSQTLRAGLEHLDAGVQTPLATLHAFNGFADVLAGARSTGNATQVGITDLYLSHELPVCWGMSWSNAVHAYGDNSIGTGLGYEFNSTLTKKFDDQFTAILQAAHFVTRSRMFDHTTRVSIELNYSF